MDEIISVDVQLFLWSVKAISKIGNTTFGYLDNYALYKKKCLYIAFKAYPVYNLKKLLQEVSLWKYGCCAIS